MKKIKILLFVAALYCISVTGYAQQGELKGIISYNVAVPTGSFKDVVDKTSFRGFDLVLSYQATDRLGTGLNIGFQDFYQKFPRAMYHLEDGSDISAVVTNTVQIIPALANVRYTFMDGRIKPYVAAGIGVGFISNGQFVGEYESAEHKAKFMARPEAGVVFALSNNVGITVGANYNYLRYNSSGIDNLSHIGIKAGISVPLRN